MCACVGVCVDVCVGVRVGVRVCVCVCMCWCKRDVDSSGCTLHGCRHAPRRVCV